MHEGTTVTEENTAPTLRTDGVTTRGYRDVSGSVTAMCLLVEHKYLLWLTCHHLTIVYRVLRGGADNLFFFSSRVSQSRRAATTVLHLEASSDPEPMCTMRSGTSCPPP